MALGAFAEAAPILAQAAEAVPQPGYQWPLHDCLRVLHRDGEADTLWKKMQLTGEREDPRTYALCLATYGRDPETALALARREITLRQDIYSHDALALALLAASTPDQPARVAEARREMERALAVGTRDPRLFLHAALISERAGDPAGARQFAHRAEPLRRSLLPSEDALLSTTLDRLSSVSAQAVARSADDQTPGFGSLNPRPDNQTKK